MRRGFDGRLDKLELGARMAPDPDQERKARVFDGWLLSVTGKRLCEMSPDELRRIEELFRGGGDDPIPENAADLVLGCMDANQVVVDLDRRRQQLDRGPFK